ncbi:5-methylcytosine rRNA methyltransferase NSUN4 [Agrilus planipennis]|uniref:NOL1/NOP2/Sun domain family member 4 n=1 Tax=Agrilus planipennis TaxID=224129 RepID=A0A1W4WRA5_AGRPL|nr:5-methylcytosine rRNA methyltransferase NSUN4 [Agrilus planipennis]
MNNYKVLKILATKQNVFVRYKCSQRKILPKDRALEHFDEFYLQVFGNKWSSVRQGLLGKQKYVAVINNYSDTEQVISTLENCGALNMRALFNVRKQNLQENYDVLKRDRYLRKIWKLEKELDKSVNSVNEHSEEETKFNEQFDKYKMLSLNYKLNHANYDDSRYIDCTAGLSANTLQEFIPATQIKGKDKDYVLESEYYEYCKEDGDFNIPVEKEYDLNFPEHLNVYCFPEGSGNKFTQPRKGSTGVHNYYILDGGSVLPVLALDIRPGNTIMDLCASPGGKSFIALQTLYPDCVVSNDISKSRTDRIYKVLGEYFYDLEERWLKTKRIKVTQNDGRLISGEYYDRVLVDVPCTTDRHSVKENDNNIFKSTRLKERLKLPEFQTELLVSALKMVKKGGIVVYSTCSLSPVQNDGVVYMALQELWEDSNMEFVVKNLNFALAQTQDVFKLADANIFRYGNVVLPSTHQNYGPTYFCKIQRIK